MTVKFGIMEKNEQKSEDYRCYCFMRPAGLNRTDYDKLTGAQV